MKHLSMIIRLRSTQTLCHLTRKRHQELQCKRTVHNMARIVYIRVKKETFWNRLQPSSIYTPFVP